MNPHAWMLLIGRGRATTAKLQVAASAVTTLLAFAVVMLAAAYLKVPTGEIGYQVLAFSLLALLLVPLVTLGTATARLAARGRDDRLATLRLLGLTSGRVRRIAVAEVTLLAAAGVALGTIGSIGLPFALSLLSVHGEPLRPDGLWLPWWLTATIPLALVIVAALSGLLGLRRVVLTPLGVRTRQDAPRMSWARAVLGVATIGGAVLLGQLASPGWGLVLLIAALTAAVVAVMAILGLVGPLAISLASRRIATRTADPDRLVAARGIQDDPKGAWRSVSALALASFVLLPAGSMLSYLDLITRSERRTIMTPDQLLMLADARTMLIALVAVSFLVVACQVALTQTATILENQELYVALDRIGMPRRSLERMRRLRVTIAANIAVVGATGTAAIVTFPLLMVGAVSSPLATAAIALILILGLLLVRSGITLTRPVLTRVLGAPARGA